MVGLGSILKNLDDPDSLWFNGSGGNHLNFHRPSKLYLISLTVLLLAACAGADVRPIVDMKGVNEARYENDLAECQSYAKEASGMGGTAAKGAGAGAVVGGLLGLVTGGNRTEIAQAAGAGAVIGGAGGAYKGNESQEAIVKKCLAGRGYKVLNWSNSRIMKRRFINPLLCVVLLLSSPLLQASWFDRKDDPVDLILNQKDCIYMKTYRGKMVKGDFIRPDRWTGSKFSIGEPTIIASLKRIDNKTALFTNVNNIGDGKGVKVYVSKTDQYVQASLQDGYPVMQCELQK